MKNGREEEFEEFAYMQALENAVNYNGQANPKALVGKCVPKFPFMKDDMSHYMNLLSNICNQVNSLSLTLQIEKLKEINPDFFQKKETKKEEKNSKLLALEGMENGKVVTRFSPAPSGNLHLGHLYGIVYNYEYAKEFGGKFILRIEDTNPENIDISNYNSIIDDIKWLTDDNISEIYYQSDRMDIYYKYLRTLIELSKAYVCECKSDVFKAYNDSSEPCPHRDMPKEKQIEMYENFFNDKYKEGEAIIRFKGDLSNKNPALRDFPLARIKIESHARLKNKYTLWPMYNLCSAVDDYLMGISHIIRGKDHEINGFRQDMIKEALGFTKCFYFHYGRIKFIDIELSKTKLSELIENKTYSGWDDPRVPSLISYRKRGYKAEAFRNMIITGGMSKRDSKITDEEYHKNLNYFNKQILEKEADRYFFVYNPKTIHIENIQSYPEKEIILPKHPDYKDRGNRHFKLENEYMVDGVDFDNISIGDMIRLMHFANFLVEKKENDKIFLKYISKDFDRSLKVKRNIHFLPLNSQRAIMVMQDNSHLKGYVEDLDNIKKNSNVQFERFGFSKYDGKKDEELIFYFTHR